MAGSGATDADRGGAGASEARRLAEEHASLRRIATLVARQTPQAEVFTAVAEELGRVLGVEAIRMVRFDEGGDSPCAEVVASWGAKPEVLRVGERAPLGGDNITTAIFENGGSPRPADYSTPTGESAHPGGPGGRAPPRRLLDRDRRDRRAGGPRWHRIGGRRSGHGRGPALGRDDRLGA